MSWLLGLAEKAEDFLVKVDQSAAVALAKNDEKININYNVAHQDPNPAIYYSNHSYNNPSLYPSANSSLKSVLNPSSSVPSNLALYNSNNSALKKSNTSAVFSTNNSPSRQKEASKDSDEKLFEFLNSRETTVSKTDKVRAFPVINGNHSRESSISSVQSSKSSRTEDNSTPAFEIIEKSEPGVPQLENFVQEIIADEKETIQVVPPLCTSENTEKNSFNHSEVEESNQDAFENIDKDHKMILLEKENNLLRNEILSLNQEMEGMLRRVKYAEEECEFSKKKLDHRNSQSSHTEQLIRELQSREADLQEALNAKDSQLAVLRIRLQEADDELKIKRNLLENLEVDKTRILKDHLDSNDIQSQALESLQQKLQETEQALHREQEALKIAQAESFERISKMEQDQRSLAETLTSVQKKLSDEKNRSSEFANHLKTTKSHLESTKQEWEDYKQKAQRILQSKEKLIVGLKAGNGSPSEISSLVNMELEELKQEKDILKEELQLSNMALENLRTEMQDLENQTQINSEISEEKIKILEEELKLDRKRREDLEVDYDKEKKELKYLQDELHRQKTSFLSRIQDRDREIDKLRKQLTNRNANNSSQNELEAKLHALTENLIHKQTMLEALGTEKNSLVLQLERLEKNYKELQNSFSRSNMAAINLNDNDEVRTRIPGFLKESPFDTGVTKSVKRAYNTIDAFSIRLGIFLRRYPMARIFVIFYMMILHFWVMIVLLTYTPEIHDIHSFPNGNKK